MWGKLQLAPDFSPAQPLNTSLIMKRLPNSIIRKFFAALFAITLALRLCHSHLLWPDEDYHLAAAQQLLRGKMLYRDLWYDKPPLAALTYAIIGAPTGWPLRLFDSLLDTSDLRRNLGASSAK